MTTTSRTLAELARLVNGRVIGDERVAIRRVASIEDAGPGDITFVAHARYRALLGTSKASAIIVGPRVPAPAAAERKSFLVVARPTIAFARILQLFSPAPVYDGRVSPQAVVDPTAVLGEGVTVFPHVYVGKEARVGPRSVLFPGVFLGDRAAVGEDCVLHARVSVREGCRIGNRVVLHDGVVVGSDGFGYVAEGSERVKVPQVGIVEIEDDVEVGANTTVDRATLGRTVIGRGTKIDNLVQIAHNVVIGENSVIAAQTGIAGSTRIGKSVIVAGQSGVGDHLEIGDGAVIGPKSGVAQSVPPRAVMTGTMLVMPHGQWLKVMSLVPRLPELWRALRDLEKKVVRRGRGGRKGV